MSLTTIFSLKPIIKHLRLICFIGVFVLSVPKTWAYPHFIGYGYTTCLVCHFNPLGNGPLTDYGRALGATAIAQKPLYNREAKDEELGMQSGFLGSTALPWWLRPSADYRGLIYKTGIGFPNSAKPRWINMKADLELVIHYLKNNQGYFSGSIGYIPRPPGQENNDKIPVLISREHYASYAITRQFRMYGGFMDHAYGIRTADHTAVSRTMSKNKQNDQTHGILAHITGQKFEIALHGFLGNLFQSSEKRQKGVSTMFEYDVAEKARLGASLMFATGEVRSRMMGATHLRLGFGEGSALLAELGLVNDALKNIENNPWGGYLHTQSLARLARGIHFLFTADVSSQKIFQPSARNFIVGPGIQWFPMQRLELRADIFSQRSLGANVVADDTFSATGQVHLWF